MGFLGKKKQPKLHTCVFCSDLVPGDSPSKTEHYKTHLIEVTDNDGLQAFTFICPHCGPMDLAWGGGKPDPQGTAVGALQGHYINQHRNYDLM